MRTRLPSMTAVLAISYAISSICPSTLPSFAGQTVVDIGPGCSNLAVMHIYFCRPQSHSLILLDSQEILDQLPDEPFITKIPAYPQDCLWVFDKIPWNYKCNFVI